MTRSFNTKARTVELLGRSQIRDGVTAISELVKNAYDADADYVELHFGTGQTTNDAFIIADHGCGMSIEEFENNWLVLGTTGKRDKKRTKGGRPLLGAKGVGRLAVGALGDQLIICSKSTNSSWLVAYINWLIFENSNLLLDDVNIPYIELSEITQESLDMGFSKLQQIQIDNLALPEWYNTKNNSGKLFDEVDDFIYQQNKRFVPSYRFLKYNSFDEQQAPLFKLIFNNINDLTINKKLICSIAEGINKNEKHSGTILYVSDLRSNWNLRDQKNKQVLNNLSRTLAWLFNNDNIGMKAMMFCGMSRLDNIEKDFEAVHYDYYDIKFKGKIKMDLDGIPRFYGTIDVLGGDKNKLAQVNCELQNGLQVGDRLGPVEYKDCGVFEIEVCHIEGDQWMTNLPMDIWQEISGLIQEEHELRKGGIRVFRDNTRILPYGEAGNDFLGIEYRRTLKAGRWLFSHRNTFGRIFLTRDENDNLREKTSREGFVEDEYYVYFQNTCIDLLLKMASLYLNDESRYKLRNDYAVSKTSEHNQNVNIDKERRILLLKLKQRIKETQEKIDNFDIDDILHKNDYYFLIKQSESVSELSPIQVSQLLDNFIKLRNEINIILVNKIEISSEMIHEGSIRFRRSWEHYNSIFDKIRDHILVQINHKIESLQLVIDRYIYDRVSSFELVNEMILRVKNEMEKIDNDFKSVLNEVSMQVNSFYNVVNENKRWINDKLIYPNDLIQMKKNINDNLRWLESAIKSMNMPDTEIFDVATKLDDMIIEYQNDVNMHCSNVFERFNNTILSLPINGSINFSKNYINEYEKSKIKAAKDSEDLIELANIGLASDILSHEFMQHISLTQEAIDIIRRYHLGTKGDFWIKTLDVSVKAISNRLVALQPIHKSRKNYREPIKLRSAIDGVLYLFQRKSKRNGILIENLIPDDVIIYGNQSRFLPSICNIFDNMFHWVMFGKDIKIIRVDYLNGQIDFSNSGPCIRKEIATHLFTPFFSTKDGGRGLGLYLSRESLRSMKWDLILKKSEDIDGLGGPVFCIVIPEIDRME